MTGGLLAPPHPITTDFLAASPRDFNLHLPTFDNGRSIFVQVLINIQVLLINESLTTFSPSGKLAQIEYALAAVGQGLPSLGIRCSNGVVLASEKPHPSILSDQSSFEKISRVTPDAGVVYSGMGPDFRVLVDKARKGAHAVRSSCSPVTGVNA